MSAKDAATNSGKSLLPNSVLRGLSDNSYERRKAAALELESLVRRLIESEELERLNIVVNMLLNDYALSLQVGKRERFRWLESWQCGAWFNERIVVLVSLIYVCMLIYLRTSKQANKWLEL